ncbi:hypothetical protein FKP32DRAFT_1598899 [Trametes sanguinea]|nr:hypothetical protein FKP32DRAFT_1598899 [Trametes sanguinea]
MTLRHGASTVTTPAYFVSIVSADAACMAPAPGHLVLPDGSIAHGYFRALLRPPRLESSGNAYRQPKLRTSSREHDQ